MADAPMTRPGEVRGWPKLVLKYRTAESNISPLLPPGITPPSAAAPAGPPTAAQPPASADDTVVAIEAEAAEEADADADAVVAAVVVGARAPAADHGGPIEVVDALDE